MYISESMKYISFYNERVDKMIFKKFSPTLKCWFYNSDLQENIQTIPWEEQN